NNRTHPPSHTLKRAFSESSTSTSSTTTTTNKPSHTHKASRLSRAKQFLRSHSNSPTTTSSNHSSPSSSLDIPRSTPSNSTMTPAAMSSSPVSLDSMDHPHSKPSTPTRRTGDDYRRYNNTVNHYGRHSNDWLFGGFSLRDTVRGGVDRLRHHH
ncbi:hypothetical protein BO71DRAFT_302979, partial [Aspergillus ellipticus CBS 707.79]